jgi:hypothetical protein
LERNTTLESHKHTESSYPLSSVLSISRTLCLLFVFIFALLIKVWFESKCVFLIRFAFSITSFFHHSFIRFSSLSNFYFASFFSFTMGVFVLLCFL